MYTLSSPTVLATDAATRPEAVPVLRALSSAFRLTEDGALALAQAYHESDSQLLGVAWDSLQMLALATPSMPEALRAAGAASLPDPDELAGIRFGNAVHVAALVAREAMAWPDGTAVLIPGAGLVPASAAAAAAWVAGPWAEPELDSEHAQVLRAPFERATRSGTTVAEPTSDLYGPRGEAVLELIEWLRSSPFSADQLASVTWPVGVWSEAMHQAAWACLHEGRLRAQMRAVLDVTHEFLRNSPALTPAAIRCCLPTLHAMVARRLIGDVLEPQALGELALADVVL